MWVGVGKPAVSAGRFSFGEAMAAAVAQVVENGSREGYGMTIQRKVQVGFVWLAVLVIALVGLGVSVMVWLNSWKTDYSDTVAQVDYANQLVIAEASMLNYAVLPLFDSFGKAQTAYEVELARYITMANDALNAATSSEDDPDDLMALAALGDLLVKYKKAIDDTLALARTFPARAYEQVTTAVLPVAREIDAAADSYKETQTAEQAALLARLDNRTNLMMIMMAVLGGIAFMAAIVAAVTLSRSIAKQLRAAVSGISGSAAELLSVASQVAASTAQGAASATETTATVEEVKQTALLAHEKASAVAESSQNLANLADAGRANVEETIAGFDRIAGQMSVMAETIDRLGEQTAAVGDIITTVSDLAEQSNLLSVNASIEAAKAGDQGKGFTVVAQEVKMLADQSKQAVTQVRTILNEIRRASTLAVQAAEQGRETVAAGRQQSLESGDAVQVITQTANEAAQSAVQISASSRQQLAGMEQISQAIESINQAGLQSAAGTRQVEQEVRQLQDLAVRLKRLVDAKATA
jgi:methyl-accepting chemotaxis protein